MTEFKVLGHRGLPSLAPENTLASFESLVDHGGSWLETDVGITSDHGAFLLHDDYLDRTTTGTGALADSTTKEVESLSAGAWYGKEYAKYGLPTLDQLVEFVNTHPVNLNLELKAVVGVRANELADVLIPMVVAALRQIKPGHRIIVSSFNPVMLLKFRALAPEFDTAILFEDHTFYDDWTLIAQACGAKIVHPQNEHLTKETVKMMKDQGYEVNVWTVNDPDRANELKNWGVDGVFTDYAHRLLQLEED